MQVPPPVSSTRESPSKGAFQVQKFGRYYLLYRIATGGMAEVFKAKSYSDAGFEKLLVIKRILEHLSGNEEFVDKCNGHREALPARF